jgi:membrane protein YdbS with pleckstrin-like domain
MSTPAFRRIVRRETHSPRTVAMIIATVILILALVYIGTEIVLHLLAQPALWLGPAAAFAWIIGLPTAQPTWAVVAGGIVLAVIGLVFVFLALAPGRLPKHQMAWADRAIVVDNGVIASSLAQHLSDETGVAREDISVGVSHRRVDVTVTPGLGVPLDAERVREIVETEMATYQLTPSVKTRVRTLRRQESGLS